MPNDSVRQQSLMPLIFGFWMMLLTRRCGGRSSDFDRCWARVPSLLEVPPAAVLSEGGLGEAWVAEEAVASALYCYWRSPDSYTAAVLCAVNTDGDSDSIATIVGSIMGARLGLGAIPETWRRRVERSAELHELGRRLHEARRPPR